MFYTLYRISTPTTRTVYRFILTASSRDNFLNSSLTRDKNSQGDKKSRIKSKRHKRKFI